LLHGVGGNYHTTYAPCPIWFSNQKLAYLVNNTNYFVWRENKILFWGNQISISIINRKSYIEIVKDIAKINGNTRPIPEWVNQGAIIGLQGGTAAVLDKYNILKKANAKITGLWLQDWVSKRISLGYSRLWWNW
jgi:alpha-glucosidase